MAADLDILQNFTDIKNQNHLPIAGEANESAGKNRYVVVVQLGSRSVGLVVEALPYQEEVVIKSMGPILSGIRGMAGATITGDGKVVLILDVGEILQDIQIRGHQGVSAVSR